MIETEKSQGLQLASGRLQSPAKRSNIILVVYFQSEDLKTGRADGINSSPQLAAFSPRRASFSSQKAGKDWYPSSSSVYSPSDLQLIAWGPPTLERAICFIQSNYSNANLILKPSVFKNSPLSYPLQPFKYLWGSPYAKNCQSKFQHSSFASILILDCRGILPGEVKVLSSL